MATSIPSHNAHELCDAALHLIKHPDATVETLVRILHPRSRLSRPAASSSMIASAASSRPTRPAAAASAPAPSGRSRISAAAAIRSSSPKFRSRCRSPADRKDRRAADRPQKLPLLEDIRDESAEDVRVVLVPKNRTVDPTILMESMFKLTELESRFPLNMNVLSMGRIPRVMALNEVLKEWLDHRREVLQRRSRFRLAAIDRRLEILGGLLIAYLNIDEVIRIIREEDEPKPVMVARWGLTDNQVEAILNMRLRSLRKLEEFEIRTEFDALTKEKGEIEALLASDDKQWQTVAWEIGEVKKKFAKATELGRRRTQFAEAPDTDEEAIQQAMIEKEPITVVVSEKGWIRALKGHISDTATLTFKEGDALRIAFPAQTTDKILI
jgi:topoisomerase-4 subunit A